MDKILLVQGDDLPRVSFIVVDKQKKPIPLVGCTAVKMIFKKVSGGLPPVEIDCTFNVTTSEVSFEFSSDELDNIVGDCEGEVVLYYGTKKHTVWDVLEFTVRKRLQ